MTSYDDIIDMPHHVSLSHPQMPRADRAAQFSPFAALTGYEDAIKEEGRLTESKTELCDDRKREIDSILSSIVPRESNVEITYFEEDARKSGGHYITLSGKVTKITQTHIAIEDGTYIPISSISDIILK